MLSVKTTGKIFIILWKYTQLNTHEPLNFSEKLTSIDWEGPISAALFLRLSAIKWTEQQIRESILLPRLENEALFEHQFRQIPVRSLLLKAAHFLSTYGPDQAFNMFREECRLYIENKIQLQEKLISKSIQSGNLVFAEYLIERMIKQIALDLPFKWLNPEESYPLLAPLFTKKEKIKNFTDIIESVIVTVCERALPGTILEEDIHQELKKLAPLLRVLPEIRPITVINYLDRPEIVNLIHEKIIDTRVKYCLPLLVSTEDSLQALQAELRKMTVYRVRRNVLDKLFISYFNSIKSKRLSADQDKILFYIQEAYLHALIRETDNIENSKVRGYLEEFRSHPTLQPLPPKGFFTGKNDRAQRELQLLIENLDPEGKYGRDYEPRLYDVNCPIEVDVLGEIVRELVDLTTYSDEDTLEAAESLRKIHKTYKKIQSIYFTPDPLLTDLIYNESDFSLIREKIFMEQDNAIRRDVINSLYLFAKRTFTDSAANSDRLAKIRNFLVLLYFEVFQSELEKMIIENEREKYLCFHAVIQPAFKTALLQDSSSEAVTKRFYDVALKLILSK